MLTATTRNTLLKPSLGEVGLMTTEVERASVEQSNRAQQSKPVSYVYIVYDHSIAFIVSAWKWVILYAKLDKIANGAKIY